MTQPSDTQLDRDPESGAAAARGRVGRDANAEPDSVRGIWRTASSAWNTPTRLPDANANGNDNANALPCAVSLACSFSGRR